MRPSDKQKIIDAHAAERRESAEQAREYAKRKKAEQEEYDRQSKEDIESRRRAPFPSYREQRKNAALAESDTDPKSETKYPSWKDAQKQATDQQLSPQVRRANRQKALRAYSKNVKERMSSGEMSPAMGYALIAISCFGAILDFITGFLPGVSEVASYAVTAVMTIIIFLDPELRKQAVADRVKLILKRLVLNWTIGILEGSFYFINLFPTEVIGAVITVKMRVKSKLRR